MRETIVSAIRFVAAAGLVILTSCDRPGRETTPLSADLREQAVTTLRTGLHEQSRWVKVHAAEMLLGLDYPQEVEEVFTRELEQHADTPQYRIGIWRVLSLAARHSGLQDPWHDKIIAAFLDPNGADRVHAAETLGKLGRPVPPGAEQVARDLMQDQANPPLANLATWVLLLNDVDAGRQAFLQRLSSDDVDSRRMAAYALRFQPPLQPADAQALIQAALHEQADSPARVYLLSAAFVHASRSPQEVLIKRELLTFLDSGSEPQKHEATNALATRGNTQDTPALAALLNSPEPDARLGAAYALLRISRRATNHMTALDWLVIVAYGVGMIAVGVYYMRRTRTAEDYLLGGRTMGSWTVGLSLFATLFSTITFLSVPGEMIKNGPMILTQLLAFPVIYITISWLVIPFIMRLRVTSAYEILDLRFGASVRLLGSLIFLSIRLLWMSVIIYATTSEVLAPLLRVDPGWTPWLCAGLAIVTIGYTSIGGLRTVVLTDVIQTFILAGGAFVCLALITYALGGVGSWFPREWAPEWETPKFGFQTDARVTLGWMVLGTFLWHFCTSASDQMVIQRYLATRDVKAARRVVLISLVATASVISFLALVGFGLLGYFRQHPHMLADGQAIASHPDQLLPRFIVFALPPGLTGLMIAGLLAAAMSSLSSGLNSSCSVITVDLLGRVSKRFTSEKNHLRTARYVSLVVGGLVVLISSYISVVPGNLLEIAYRVVNLFTVPLFILFGMAMFIPWATPLGTWTGTLASMATAVLIAFWEVFTGSKGPSFLLIMPVSLVIGMASGMLVSLIPVGKARTSLADIIAVSPGEQDALPPPAGDIG